MSANQVTIEMFEFFSTLTDEARMEAHAAVAAKGIPAAQRHGHMRIWTWENRDKLSTRSSAVIPVAPNANEEFNSLWSTRFGCHHPECAVAYDNETAAGVHADHSPVFPLDSAVKLQEKFIPVPDSQQEEPQPEPQERRQRAPRTQQLQIPHSAVVSVLVSSNPKKPGSAAYERFALIESGKTISELMALGVWYGDIRGGVERGWLKAE